MKAPPQDVLTISEAAALLRISTTSTYKMAERGELPGAVKVGVQWRVSREALLSGLGLAV